MFIKKITNRKAGKTYISYRLVKSKRVEGVPRHINVLDLGSLSGLPVEKHKALANRVVQLVDNQLDLLLGAGYDEGVEEQAQYFYRKLIKKQLESVPVETERTNKKEFTEVDLNSFESIDSKEIGGEWLCHQAFEELGLSGFLDGHLGFNGNEVSFSLLSLIGRMLHPASELNTAKWLNENSAALELVWPASGTVDRNRLTNATISLYQNKDMIEDYLSGKVNDIFGLEDKYFIVSFIRHRLKQNNIHHRWIEIVRIMSTQKCNINTILDSKDRTIALKTCTRPQLKATEIYSAMKYKTVPFYRKKTYLKTKSSLRKNVVPENEQDTRYANIYSELEI